MNATQYAQQVQGLTADFLKANPAGHGDVILTLELLKLDVRDIIKVHQAHAAQQIVRSSILPAGGRG